MKTIKSLALAHNASIITDRDGNIALLSRIYDAEGLSVVRHRPDPCEFHPVAEWLEMTPEQVAVAVC